MKLFIIFILSLNFAFATSNLKSNQDSAPPTPQEETYENGTANPENPGTFTSKGPKASVPETNLEMKNHPKAEMSQDRQAEEAEFDDEVLK